MMTFRQRNPYEKSRAGAGGADMAACLPSIRLDVSPAFSRLQALIPFSDALAIGLPPWKPDRADLLGNAVL